MNPKMQFLTILAVSLLFKTASAVDEVEETKIFLEKFEGGIADFSKNAQQQTQPPAEIFVNENLEGNGARKKRETSSQQKLIRKERAIHREGSVLKINLVSFHNPDGSRSKRATYNTSTETWPLQIPYQFDSSYPVDLIPKVRRIMEDIMDHLCITWVEEPDFDPNDNFYATNAYLKFIGSEGNICGTFLGQGSGYGARNVKTCTQYYSITHELLHTLGVVHEQQGPLSLHHLTMVLDNIADGYWGGTYKLHNDPGKLETSEFDGSSIMMYSRRAFSKNGLDIMLPFREEEFDINYGRHTSLDNNYMELNQVYKCRETFCNNDDVDCGLGYYTRIKGSCKCVCPDGFDPAYNCQKLEDETSGPPSWPDIPFGLYAAEINVCPDGFSTARFDITGTRNPMWFGDAFFSTSQTTNYHMCTRDDSSVNTDMDFLPMGTYCVVKPVGLPCNGGFKEGSYMVRSTQPFASTGDYGDWQVQTYDSALVEMKFCCRWDRDWYYPIELPRQTAFRFISDNGQCPIIKGMRFELGRIAMFNANTLRLNDFPQSWLANYYLVHNFCTYTPAVYGCNQNITMGENQTSIEITTPGFANGARESNRRCFYNFNIPKGSRVKVTVNTFDIEASDQFHVRRFNKWAKPLYDFGSRYVPQFISEKDFLFLEWWSARTASTKDGIKLTAELIEDECHDDNGRSYNGEKAVSEMFEECLPWKDAADCEDFPYNGLEAIKLLSSDNHCRNPGGDMERPWCYVSLDRGMCRRAYCDVCNELAENDRLSDCSTLVANDPQFCDDALQRTKCATTCNLDLLVAPPDNAGFCGTPSTPSDGTPTAELKTTYNIGEVVSFNCDLREINENPTEIQCTQNGWPALNSACTECPIGWIPYASRCFYYIPDLRFVDQADDECFYIGGRLFVVHNASDVEVIRNFKQTSTISSAYGGSWLNIELVDNQWVIYDNNSAVAPYLDWASTAILDDPVDHGCAVMIWEYDTAGNAGKFLPTSCNLGVSRTFCEMARSPVSTCEDKSTFCSDALAYDAQFCRRSSSYQVASLYCEKSCGSCVDVPVECQEPTSSTYHVTSTQNTTEGDVMTFACNAGLYHISGDLKRACGINGNLLGDEPVCSAAPITTDIGKSGVMRRVSVSPTNTINLLDIDDFRIPFDGHVTHWHYYAELTGTIYFVVYRKSISTGLFQLVGYNTVAVTTIKQRWTHPVPTVDQIAVQDGDVYGFFTIGAQIAATTCIGGPMVLITETANDVAGLSGDKAFVGTTCLIPSLGLRLAPSN